MFSNRYACASTILTGIGKLRSMTSPGDQSREIAKYVPGNVSSEKGCLFTDADAPSHHDGILKKTVKWSVPSTVIFHARPRDSRFPGAA